MPQVTVFFFGPAKDLVGAESVRLDISNAETVGMLAGRLAESYPRLGRTLGARLAVNRAYVALDHVLADGDEVAVIPPVSGGSGQAAAMLTREPIDLDGMVRSLSRHDAGAVTVFCGTVRAETEEGKRLTALEYHAYEEMAIRQMEDIRDKALREFAILDAAIVHRLGKLELGTASIAVIVASEHRAAAFDACRWIVDAVKLDVPIWKRNVWTDGSADWVDPTCTSS